MRDYCIVCEVTADLPKSVVEELGIQVIPMQVRLGEQDFTHYYDERELSLDEFYRRLREGEVAVTSQVNPANCKEFLEEQLKKGLDVLYIAFTSGLSGTYGNGKLVADELIEEYPDNKIYVVDSLCASIGQGLLVWLAAQEKKKGMNIDDLLEYVESIKKKCCHWFPVEDLFHLKRGGRINAVEAAVGTALKVKPVISINEEGKLLVVNKVRGDKKAMEYVLQRLTDDGIDTSEQTVFVGGASTENAEKLAMLAKERGLIKDYILCEIGPIIGAHVGMGMYAMAFVGENYKF